MRGKLRETKKAIGKEFEKRGKQKTAFYKKSKTKLCQTTSLGNTNDILVIKQEYHQSLCM